MANIAKVKILRYKNGEKFYDEDIVVREDPLTIICNNLELATILCTPEFQDELAIGFLAAAGLLQDAEKISQIKYLPEEKAIFVKYADENKESQTFLRRYITTGCGMGTMFSAEDEDLLAYRYNGSIILQNENVFALIKLLQDNSQLYLSTGGVHSAALTDGKQLLVFREDIGRHNAVDKIIGHAMLNKINLSDKAMVTSGRISSEIVLKLAKAGIGCVISRSAPMERAVELAKLLNMTLIGFVRGKRLNVYCGEERLT